MLPKIEHPRCDAKFNENYLASSLWIAEKKVDGVRVYVKFDDGKVRVTARSGADKTLSFPVPYVKELEGTLLDGELYDPAGFNETLSGVQGSDGTNLLLAAFDIPFASGEDIRRKALEARRYILCSAVEVLRAHGFNKAHVLDWACDNKKEFYEAEIAEGREGIILKRKGCSYGIQWVKCKGFKDTSVVVLGRAYDHGDQAFRIGVTDLVKLKEVGLGTLKLSGEAYKLASREGVFKSLVVDIKALSFNPIELKFRQPSLLRVRPDLTPLDCTLHKVKIDFGVE